MKKLINVVHFVCMSGIIATTIILSLIHIAMLLGVIIGLRPAFGFEEWMILLISIVLSINWILIVRRKGVMEVFGFPFDEKELLP